MAALTILALFTTSALSSEYSLKTTYQGTNFFDQFNFISYQDPSNGYVQYMNESYCTSKGLVNASSSQVYIGVDHENIIEAGYEGRPSVRIESKVTYSEGLFIADFEHMPQVCPTHIP